MSGHANGTSIPPSVLRVQRRAPPLPRCECGNTAVRYQAGVLKLRPKGPVEITRSGATFACYFCKRSVSVSAAVLTALLDAGS